MGFHYCKQKPEAKSTPPLTFMKRHRRWWLAAFRQNAPKKLNTAQRRAVTAPHFGCQVELTQTSRLIDRVVLRSASPATAAAAEKLKPTV